MSEFNPYEADVRCWNCGCRQQRTFPRGTLVKKHLKQANGPCPYCGVRTHWKPELDFRLRDRRQLSDADRRQIDPDETPTLQLQPAD